MNELRRSMIFARSSLALILSLVFTIPQLEGIRFRVERLQHADEEGGIGEGGLPPRGGDRSHQTNGK